MRAAPPGELRGRGCIAVYQCQGSTETDRKVEISATDASGWIGAG